MSTLKTIVIQNGVLSESAPTNTSDSTTSSFQKYFIDINAVYTIPNGISSVISGPFENAGITEVSGRLEII